MNAPARDFELAVRAFSDDLYRYAYWLTRNPADAEDLVQDCFQRAWRSWHTLNDEKAVKQWLFAILRREFLRRFEKHRPQLLDIDEAVELAAPHPGLDEVYALRQAMHRAPPSLRDPLLLQVLGGFDCDEIAALENTTTGAVMTRLTRARQWFRAFLSPTAPTKATSSKENQR